MSQLTPERFELQVKVWLESVAGPLETFSAKHLDTLPGIDGEYTIDVTARFKALGGANSLVVVECKKHKSAIKREVVQTLRDKQQSVGAQKAMVFATSDFQRGAIEYARKHGIALVQIVDGRVGYIQATANCQPQLTQEKVDDYAGLFYGENPNDLFTYPEILTTGSNANLARFLGIDEGVNAQLVEGQS